MKRILISNRGEIAVRAVHACRALGLESVAIYTEADRDSMHVRLADHAFKVGPSAVGSSYLNQPAILHIALASDCDAVHPGYGFLSENAEFAEACEAQGLEFIGPTAETIRRMGDKYQARVQASRSGVPVVPGSTEFYTSADAALRDARNIGFPILIKARSGGGGRGMRIAQNSSEFGFLFSQCTEEAKAAFGDGAVYLEKYLSGIRHLEVQILGDVSGDVRALGERDCTVQRRHQKLVEEAPCTVISNEVRERLVGCAVQLGKSIGYRGLGTVEFVLCEDLETFYFIEMNTRIQVEHPVTESLYGIDLVEAQIQLAMGECVSKIIDGCAADGHAIEFRINAESWEREFLPSPGQIVRWLPAAGAGVRVDTHVHDKFRVEPFYDSMIAKLIIHAASRPEALQRASEALDRFVVDGVDTTIGFHRKLLQQQQFLTGDISTNWVESEFMTEV